MTPSYPKADCLNCIYHEWQPKTGIRKCTKKNIDCSDRSGTPCTYYDKGDSDD